MKNEPVANDLFVSQTHELLAAEGYKLIDDAWKEFGRRTYLHDDDANRDYIKAFGRVLKSVDWQTNSQKVRTFHHPISQHEIELEPAGSEATGHFLHHMRPEPSKICRSGAALSISLRG